jgi:hypothetical protein
MLTRIGGNENPDPVEEDEQPFGSTGTGAQAPSGVKISSPGWAGLWKRSVMLP